MKILKKIAAVAVMGGAVFGGLGQAHAGYDDLPDLVVKSVDLHPTGSCSTLSSAVVGDIVIKNVGRGRAKLLVLSPMVAVVDTKYPSFRGSDIEINSLAPGETTRAKVRIGRFKDKAGYKGWHKFVIKVDPKNKIRESNERNNTYVVRLPVSCR